MIGDTALLALAVYRFAIETVSAEGFLPVLPPVLVREEAMYGTGFFPTERSNIYALPEDDLYLTGTSEVALAGLHMGEILETLPLYYAGYSTNFRREAGAAGKDTAACSASISSTRSRCSSTASRVRRSTSTSDCSRSRRRSCRGSRSRTGS